MKTIEFTLRNFKIRSLLGLLISATLAFHGPLIGADNLLGRDVGLEIWIVNSNDLVINRQVVDYIDETDLASTITSFYEPLQSVIATLTITCEADQAVIKQVKDVLGSIGLVAEEENNGASLQQTYRTKNQCTTPPDVVLRTEDYVLHSDEIDQDYSISITLPDNYSAEQSYPLIFYTDSMRNFFSDADSETNIRGMQQITERLITSGAIPKAVVVGIGYSGRDFRNRDLTPPKTYHNPELALLDPYPSGGANKFADFIENEVKSFVYAKAQIDRTNEIYVGHSYGGLFGAYVLFKRPELFDSYVLSSPSLIFGSTSRGFEGFQSEKGISFLFEEQYYRDNMDMAKSVYISAGSREEHLAMEADSMYSILASRDYESLNLRWELLEGKDHDNVARTAYTAGLTFAFENRSK